MTKSEIEEMVDRILSWPRERRAALGRMIELVEDYDNNDMWRTDE
jgi:hypothetical protein